MLWAVRGWNIPCPTLPPGCILPKTALDVLLADEHSELRFLVPGRPLSLQRENWKYLSVFPLEGKLGGVCIRGAFYPLEDAELTADYPLGVSNEFTPEETAHLSCTPAAAAWSC